MCHRVLTGRGAGELTACAPGRGGTDSGARAPTQHTSWGQGRPARGAGPTGSGGARMAVARAPSLVPCAMSNVRCPLTTSHVPCPMNVPCRLAAASAPAAVTRPMSSVPCQRSARFTASHETVRSGLGAGAARGPGPWAGAGVKCRPGAQGRPAAWLRGTTCHGARGRGRLGRGDGPTGAGRRADG